MPALSSGHPVGGVFDKSCETHHDRVSGKKVGIAYLARGMDCSTFYFVEIADFIADASRFLVAFRRDRLVET